MLNKIIILILIVYLISTLGIVIKYIPIELAIQKVKNQEYIGGHKCLQFSRDLINELEKRGVQASIEIGESPRTAEQEDIRHAWVGIWVEPQTGSFTNKYFK